MQLGSFRFFSGGWLLGVICCWCDRRSVSRCVCSWSGWIKSFTWATSRTASSPYACTKLRERSTPSPARYTDLWHRPLGFFIRYKIIAHIMSRNSLGFHARFGKRVRIKVWFNSMFCFVLFFLIMTLGLSDMLIFSNQRLLIYSWRCSPARAVSAGGSRLSFPWPHYSALTGES